METLIKIRSELKAPKGQRNDFGKYAYRSAEDVLEHVFGDNSQIVATADELEVTEAEHD